MRQEVLENLLHSDKCVHRKICVREGYKLDVLVRDKDADVRLDVAKRGYRLDVLVHDEDHRVRTEVAKHGYGLVN